MNKVNLSPDKVDQDGASDKSNSPLDVGRIVHATRRLVETAGVENVTMRRVAAELGVSPMGLYHHVRDKRALLALVADDVMGSADFPNPGSAPWHDVIRQGMLSVHQTVIRYPGLGMYIWGPQGQFPSYPDGDRQIHVVLHTLLSAGFDEREALSAIHLLAAYEGGFFRMGGSGHDDRASRGSSTELSDKLMEYGAINTGSWDVYREGLETIIAGLRAQLAAKQILINDVR